MQCIGPTMKDGEVSLGTFIDLSHIASTPVGLIIRIEVEVIKTDGPRVEFAFSAFDEREKIAEGTHERYITDRSKLRERIREKLT